MLEKIISELSLWAPRQGTNETDTAKFLEYYLNKNNFGYQVQLFPTRIPIIVKAELFLDGKKIECLGASFESGLISAASDVHFSPHSDYIETITYTTKPSVYISRTNADLLKKAKSISGQVLVEKYSFQSRNILVGNRVAPRRIIFAHYDCLGGGAIDNAGGVAVCLDLITTHPSLLQENLFVFAGNEELSYDQGDYWGKGYREFEKENTGILITAEEILVVDGVGITSPVEITKDFDNFFPIKYLKQLASKITVISSTQSEVMKVYHCAEDTIDKLNKDFLYESMSYLQQKFQN